MDASYLRSCSLHPSGTDHALRGISPAAEYRRSADARLVRYRHTSAGDRELVRSSPPRRRSTFRRRPARSAARRGPTKEVVSEIWLNRAVYLVLRLPRLANEEEQKPS